MTQQSLLHFFMQFGLAGMLGLLIGLEREISGRKSISMGGRDFVLFALVGAGSAFLALRYQLTWLVLASFFAIVVVVMSRYWKDDKQGPGITTEISAILTFVLGVLVMYGAQEIAIALAIVTFALLAHKRTIKAFRAKLKSRDVQAALKFLVITFIVLPVLPRQSLDTYLVFQVARVEQVGPSGGELTLRPLRGRSLEVGERVGIVGRSGDTLREVPIVREIEQGVVARLPEDTAGEVEAGAAVHAPLGIEFVNVMLSAIKPYTLWLIVILVSLISLVGYVLIKLMGGAVGVSLTGLIGGLVSSTVTTLSFARRSLERPELNRSLAVAILFASSMMFPRLLLEMFVVNRQLAVSVAPPLVLMSATGFALAFGRLTGSRRSNEATKPVEFDNPFSLTAALTFGLVFAAILMLTRTATHYLGDTWLPAVALVSGLTDADAIAFSVSEAHLSDWISLRWASLNLVIGAIANTLMKLGLVFMLADRGLFRELALSFATICVVGLATTLVYYWYLPVLG
jgi:uncharacterized membrane protein (DUF4010 family)